MFYNNLYPTWLKKSSLSLSLPVSVWVKDGLWLIMINHKLKMCDSFYKDLPVIVLK